MKNVSPATRTAWLRLPASLMMVMVVVVVISIHAVPVPATAVEIRADSVTGRNLLSQSRRLDNNNNNAGGGGGGGSSSDAWIAGYSVKFQGCVNIKQWNEYAQAEDDVRIATKSLVRYRLCPSGACSGSKAAGCTAGYGDYVVDLPTFVYNYFDARARNIEATCAAYAVAKCSCSSENDDSVKHTCEYDCFSKAKLTQCLGTNNPYENEAEGKDNGFAVENYMACSQLKIGNNNNGNPYYVGPYCANQGGDIYLGLFNDDTCSEATTGTTFAAVTGLALPYNNTSIVDWTCLSCVEPTDVSAQDANDQVDADSALDECAKIYTLSGKCEANLPTNVTAAMAAANGAPNEAACQYLEGIKIVRANGIITSTSPRPSAVATSFIVIAAMAFCSMAFYVWYLRTRLGVPKDSLL